MEQKRFKLTTAAKILGISPWTLRRQFYENKVPGFKSPSGRIFFSSEWVNQQLDPQNSNPKSIKCVLYARESSSENKSCLASQVESLKSYATAKGYQISKLITEFGSGLNDNRPKLENLLRNPDFDVLIVEHKDRLTRFGFHWFEVICPFRIEVINAAQNQTNDLMEDLVSILTSFSARLYGQRRGRKKTEAAIKAIREQE